MNKTGKLIIVDSCCVNVTQDKFYIEHIRILNRAMATIYNTGQCTFSPHYGTFKRTQYVLHAVFSTNKDNENPHKTPTRD